MCDVDPLSTSRHLYVHLGNLEVHIYMASQSHYDVTQKGDGVSEARNMHINNQELIRASMPILGNLRHTKKGRSQ